MIGANATPVRRNENIGTPTLAPLKTGSRARSSRLRGRSCAERPTGSTASGRRLFQCEPLVRGVGAVVNVSHIRQSECLLQRE